MNKWMLLAGIALLASCNGGGTNPPTGGTATYRIEITGSLNAGAPFQATYATSTGQAEVFSKALPATKEITAGASVYVLADGTVAGGGTITVKAFKNNALCEEKTLAITDVGVVQAACNRP